MSFNYFIPIVIVIISNVIYHITAKNIPQEVNSFLSLVITYLVSMVTAVLIYFITPKSNSIIADIHKLNWTSCILGLAIVGVETGYIYMYRMGWNVSKGSLIASISLSILLIIIGILFFKEHIGLHQIAGIGCCIVGLILINLN